VGAVDTYTGLSFRVPAGRDDVGRPQTCIIDADLYRPHSASTADRVATILTTNGFGGSKADQAGLGRAFVQRGYAVLSYTGLGFPGSGCKIALDDPAVDGVAASRLVTFLGGGGNAPYASSDMAGAPGGAGALAVDFGVGIADGIRGAGIDPSRELGCRNFGLQACQAKATLDTLGYPTTQT